MRFHLRMLLTLMAVVPPLIMMLWITGPQAWVLLLSGATLLLSLWIAA